MDRDAEPSDMDWELADSLSGSLLVQDQQCVTSNKFQQATQTQLQLYRAPCHMAQEQNKVVAATGQLQQFKPWIWHPPAGQQVHFAPWTLHAPPAQPPVRFSSPHIPPQVHVLGLLERVPDSWLYQFIRSLPAASKEALLRCSRHLARHVIGAAGGVKLRLQDKEAIPPQQTEMRQRIITSLLRGRQDFTVQLWAAGWQPFPTELADRVTSIMLQTSRLVPAIFIYSRKEWAYPASDCCSWSAMSNLRKVCFQGFGIRVEDVSGLCAAVEAGQLQQLRSLEVHECQEPPNLDRLVRTLGPQLEELSTDCGPLLMRVSQLTILRCLSAGRFTVTDLLMSQLCEHPTLRHLTLHLGGLREDHSHHPCRWETLTVQNARVSWLPCLPLAGVQKVHLQRGVLYDLDLGDQRMPDPKAVTDTIAQYAHKIVCQADEQALYNLGCPNQAMIPLVKGMQGVQTLMLSHPSSPDVIPQIWMALPDTVTSIEFLRVEGIPWSQLWQGLPQHVSQIRIDGGDITAPDLCTLVCTAPLHVHTIALFTSNETVHAAWEVAAHHPLTPTHLQVELVFEPLFHLQHPS